MLIIGMGQSGESVAKHQHLSRKEWILDLILLLYACVTYTAVWQTLSHGVDVDKENPMMFIVNCVLASIIFLIFYMPLRIPYYLEEIAQMKTSWDWVKFLGSLGLVLGIVIWNL